MAGKRLDGRLSLVRRLVRQHRLARGVADGEDVRVTGAALAVDDEEALRIDGDVGVLQAEAVAVRPPAHGEKDAAELPHLLDAVGLEGGFDCILLVDQAEEFRARVDRLELLLESFVQRADEVAIDAGQQAVGHLDHGDAAAQRGVHGAHFQANVAAANHQQRLRRVDQLQGRGGIHDPRSRQIEGGNPRRPRARRDDAMLEANAVVGQGLSVERTPIAASASPRRRPWRGRPAPFACRRSASDRRRARRRPFLSARRASSRIVGGGKTTPQASRRFASSMTLATWSRAFEGMQPRSRQTPPRRGSRSTRATCIPRSAAKNAAAYPPGPPPTTTSCVFMRRN